MTLKSSQCAIAAEIIAAVSIIHGIGPQKYAMNARSGCFFSPGISFGPYCSRSRAASCAERPDGRSGRSGEVGAGGFWGESESGMVRKGEIQQSFF